MEEMRTILYMFREKLAVEQVGRWEALDRMKQLRGCTTSTIYMLETDGELYFLGLNNFRNLADLTRVPEEIKLAALIVN